MSDLPTTPTNKQTPFLVVLAADQGLVTVHVEVQSFLDFNRQMSGDLARLEERFADFATAWGDDADRDTTASPGDVR